MYQETQHLYELLGPEQFKEAVLTGLDRLLSALDEKASLLTCSTYAYDPNRHVCETTDGRALLLETDLNKTMEMKIEADDQLYDVCSILGALALPSAYNDLGDHVREAFDQLENTVSGLQSRRATRLAARQDETAPSRTPPTAASPSDHLRTGAAWASPFLKFLNKINADLGPAIHQMTKNDLKSHIETHWDHDSLDEPSEHKVDAMGTLLRQPKAQMGRAQPKRRDRHP